MSIPRPIIRAVMDALKAGIEPRTDAFYDFVYNQIKDKGVKV